MPTRIDEKLTGAQLHQLRRETVDFLSVYLDFLEAEAVLYGCWRNYYIRGNAILKFVSWKSFGDKSCEYMRGHLVKLPLLRLEANQLFGGFRRIHLPGISGLEGFGEPHYIYNVDVLFFAVNEESGRFPFDVVEICPCTNDELLRDPTDANDAECSKIIPADHLLMEEIVIRDELTFASWKFAIQGAINDRLAVINPLLSAPVKLPVSVKQGLILPDGRKTYWKNPLKPSIDDAGDFLNDLKKPLDEYHAIATQQLDEVSREADRRKADRNNIAHRLQLRPGALRRMIEALDADRAACRIVNASAKRRELGITRSLAALRGDVRALKISATDKNTLLSLLA
jgi:hypothetical protein